jgi:hypothetical protein
MCVYLQFKFAGRLLVYVCEWSELVTEACAEELVVTELCAELSQSSRIIFFEYYICFDCTVVVYLVSDSCLFVNVEIFHCIHYFTFIRSMYYVHDVFYGADGVLIV